jgi:hypothetical protein
MYSAEMQAKIAAWREKEATTGLDLEDMKQIVAMLRGERKSAATSSDQAKRARAKKEIKSADDLLNELEGL